MFLGRDSPPGPSNLPESAKANEPALREFLGGKGMIRPTDDGFEVTAEMEGTSARDLNRKLPSGRSGHPTA